MTFPLFVLASIAIAVFWYRKRTRNTPPIAVNFLSAHEAFSFADQYCVEAQKAEAAGDIDTALLRLGMATRQMSLGAQYGKFGEQRDPAMPPEAKDWEMARYLEHIRPFLRSLGLNDGFIVDA